MEEIKYIINIGNFTVNETTYPNRCLSASFGGSGIEVDTIPWGENENPWDYKYENGEFVKDEIVIPTPPYIPSQEERNKANIDYIAMCTDIELPEENV